VGYASQQGAGSAPVKVKRTVTVRGSNPKQREIMCLHCAGSALVKVNRTFTVLGSNPEQKLCYSTEGRQRHSPGFEPKAREVCLHGAANLPVLVKIKPHIHCSGFETRAEGICI
jgi:hypothetical protein